MFLQSNIYPYLPHIPVNNLIIRPGEVKYTQGMKIKLYFTYQRNGISSYRIFHNQVAFYRICFAAVEDLAMENVISSMSSGTVVWDPLQVGYTSAAMYIFTIFLFLFFLLQIYLYRINHSDRAVLPWCPVLKYIIYIKMHKTFQIYLK